MSVMGTMIAEIIMMKNLARRLYAPLDNSNVTWTIFVLIVLNVAMEFMIVLVTLTKRIVLLVVGSRTCKSNEFQCSPPGSRLICIPLSWKCDGHVDCENGADEPTSCPQVSCDPGRFKCNNSRCIPQSWVCGKLKQFLI